MTIGRPRTVMTDDTKAKIVETVRLGLPVDRAALVHGVNAGTVRNERKRDESFATDLKKAEADAEANVVAKLYRHMDDQWTSCAWWLERRHPERWGKREAPLSKGEVRAFLANLREATATFEGMVPKVEEGK